MDRTARSAADRSLYGWSAPVSISTTSALGIVLVSAIVTAQLGQALLINAWGSPPGSPLVPYTPWKIVLLCGAAGMVPLAWATRKYALLIPMAAVLCTLASAPLYSPHHYTRALVRAIQDPTLIQNAVVATLGGAILAAALIRGVLGYARAGLSRSKGSTEWGDGEALRTAQSGLLLGRHCGSYLRYNGPGHLLTVAATRSGKGVGTVIPNLLTYPGSTVVTDPKGENFMVTGSSRKNAVALDPFGLTRGEEQRTEKYPAFNPLDLIDVNHPDHVETAMMLADMIVGRGHRIEESHWHLESKGLLFTFILHVASAPGDAPNRNLIRVRELITLDPLELDKLLSTMAQSALLPQVREGARRIRQKADRERSGVFSTAQSYTHFLTSPRMAQVLGATFKCDLESLRTSTLSLYLVLPREYLTTYAQWLRLMISSCYYVCSRNAAQKPHPGQNVLFLLDEFANLGYMRTIKEAVSLGSGYGITLWLILQDLAQLRREYRDEWESFVANCDVIQAFAVQDPFTGDRISKLLGEMTIWQRRLHRRSGNPLSKLVAGYEEAARPLLKPEELRRLHPKRQILLVRPYQPVVADKVVYYTDPLLMHRAQPNPYVINR